MKAMGRESQITARELMMESRSFLHCSNLVKIFQVAELEVVALQGLNLEMGQGEMLALIGPSGVGKSTLLNVIGGLDRPSAGSVRVAGWDLLRMRDRDRVRYKRQVVGFVWQQPSRNLLPYLSARENVELPMQYNRVRPAARKKRALELLETVGLADRANFRPSRLSGGEQQRVALAVALANEPPLLLGDELTGQVDSRSAMRVLDALEAINQTFGTTIIVVTHDPLVAGRMDRVVTIRDGRTSTEIRRQRNPLDGSVAEEEWVILDQVGRLQLPRASVSALEMRELVKLHLETDHISIWPKTDVSDPNAGQDSSPSSAQIWNTARALVELWTRGRSAGLPIVVEKLSRTFRLPGQEIHALRDLDLEIPTASLTVIKGPSGSGKTTLLNLIAGLDEPSSGTVRLGERSVPKMSPEEKVILLQEHIGYVFQTFGLLPFLTVKENVQIPLRLLHTSPEEREARVEEVLAMVGLGDRAEHRTDELSGGEQQRVAIARALVKRPALILADEPTGQLDSLTGASIIALLQAIASQTGITVLVASHDPNVHEAADRLVELRDGQLVEVRDQDRTPPVSPD